MIESAILAALVPVAGWWSHRLRGVSELSLPGRLAAYMACGSVTIATSMLALSLCGLVWPKSLPVWLVTASVAVRFFGRRGRSPSAPPPANPVILLGLVPLTITMIGILAGAATSFDFLFFWGSKGQAFGLSRAIDVQFLTDPDHRQLHPDYPPLVPLLYAWTMMGGATSLQWWLALLTTPLFLFVSGLAAAGLGESARRDPWLAVLLTSVLGYLYLQNYIGGNAEPILIFFVTVSVLSLRRPARFVNGFLNLPAFALAGAALSKFEGLAFAGLAVGSFALFVGKGFRERARFVFKVSVVPVVLWTLWYLFVMRHGLADVMVGEPYGAFTVGTIPVVLETMLQEASYSTHYLPWITAALVVAFGRRTAAPHLLLSAGFVCFLIFTYMHGSDPSMLIHWSARRVLLTPLVVLLLSGSGPGTGPRASSDDSSPG